MKNYFDIKNQSVVTIGPDYPYRNIPELPLCEKLIVNNSNIERIADQISCKTLIVENCPTENIPPGQYRIGCLKEIGNLDSCEIIIIHASALERIGWIDNCKKLKILNESGLECQTENFGHISVLIRNHRGNIVYTGYQDMTLKETFRNLLQRNKTITDISLEKTQIRLITEAEFKTFSKEWMGDLAYVDFSNHTYQNVTFYNADLTGCNFQNSEFKNVMFDHCDLEAADLSHIDLQSTIFRNCNTNQTYFAYSKMKKEMTYVVDLNTEDVDKIIIEPSFKDIYQIPSQRNDSIFAAPYFQLFKRDGQPILLPRHHFTVKRYIEELLKVTNSIINIDFGATKLYPSIFDDYIDMRAMSFEKVTIENVVFERCDLSDSNFDQANLKNVKFINCNLSETSFTALDLTDTHFFNCALKDAKFEDCTILPELAGQLHAINYYPPCNVKIKEDQQISTENYFRQPYFGDFNTLWDNDHIYIITPKGSDQLIEADIEMNCYCRVAYKQGNLTDTHTIINLSNYIYRHASEKKFLEDNLEDILSIYQGNQNGLHILDKQLSHLLMGDEMSLGSHQNTLNLCDAILKLGKDKFSLYQSYPLAKSILIGDHLQKRASQGNPQGNQLSL